YPRTKPATVTSPLTRSWRGLRPPGPPDHVQGAAGAEPGDVLLRHGVGAREVEGRPVGVVQAALDGDIGGERAQADHRDAIVFPDLVVGGGVGEGEGEHPLFLEVRLVDAGE